jgi:hypothetical protein
MTRNWAFDMAALLLLVGCGSGELAFPAAVGAGGNGDAEPGAIDATSGSGSGSGGSHAASNTVASGSGGAGGGSDGLIPMFLALGEGRRTTISCDDGHSWVADHFQEDNPAAHGPYSARGLAASEGVFVAALGWGQPGKLHRSFDGVDFAQSFPGPDQNSSKGMVGVAQGNGRFLAVEGDRTWTSDDNGATWTERGEVPNIDNLRIVAFSAYGGGRFYTAGDAGQIFVSADGGDSWQAPSTVSGGSCLGNMSRRGGPVDGAGLFLIITHDGTVCRSDDGGDSFSIHNLAPNETGPVVQGNAVWTGSAFYVASSNRAFSSTDGINWTESAYNLGDANIRRVAVSDSGSFAGIARDGATFYRSDDGQQWTELGPSAATVGNDLTQIIFARAQPSASCPAP